MDCKEDNFKNSGWQNHKDCCVVKTTAPSKEMPHHTATAGSPDVQTCPVDEEQGSKMFYPPLYLQRYMLAIKYLTHHQVKKMADLGCSDCGFFRLLPTVSCLEMVSLVDIDRKLLETKQKAILPETRHYIHKRESPLQVLLYAGSAAEYDCRLQGVEAVTLIEVIEHLHEDVLHKVTENVFGTIHPDLCVVTTPNAEFNVLFDNEEPSQFRHWDHKFEWTRTQFQAWCQQVCERFGYTVEYTGVGYFSSRPDSHHLGPCSQAAVFTALGCQQSGQHTEQAGGTGQECYHLIAECSFPYKRDERTMVEKLDDEVQYALGMMTSLVEEEVTCGVGVKVGVHRVVSFPCVKKLGCSEESVRASLSRLGHAVSEDGHWVTVEVAEEEEGDDIDEDWQDEDRERDDNDDDWCDHLPAQSQCIKSTRFSTPEDTAEELWDEDGT